MLYPAVAHWNSKCFGNIERRRIQLATTNIIATAINSVNVQNVSELYTRKIIIKTCEIGYTEQVQLHIFIRNSERADFSQ